MNNWETEWSDKAVDAIKELVSSVSEFVSRLINIS